MTAPIAATEWRQTTVSWWQRPFAIALMLVLVALPLLAPPIPPMADVPAHMARMHVMLGNDAATLSHWYHYGWRLIGYVGIDLAAAVLAPVLGLDVAVKLMAIGIVLGTAAALLWLSKAAHRRIEPFAVLALPLAYSLAFELGFLNFCAGMMLALLGLAWWRGRADSRARWREAIGLGAIGWIVWITHVGAWLALGAMLFGAMLGLGWRARGGSIAAQARFVAVSALRCLPAATPIVLMIGWHPVGSGAGGDYLTALPYKPGWIAMALRDRWQWFDAASVILMLLIAYRGYRTPGHRRDPALAGAAIMLGLLFLAMPFLSAYADARLAPFAMMLALVALGGGEGTRWPDRRGLAAIAMAFLAVRSLAGTASTAIETANWQQHLRMLPSIPRGAALVTLVNSQCRQPWHRIRTGHLASLALIRRGAFANDQFDLGAASLLHVDAPGFAGFTLDPSQLVVDAPCPGSTEFRTLDAALALLPATRFDYLWLIDAPGTAWQRPWLHPIRRNGNDWLLRIDRQAAANAGRLQTGQHRQ